MLSGSPFDHAPSLLQGFHFSFRRGDDLLRERCEQRLKIGCCDGREEGECRQKQRPAASRRRGPSMRAKDAGQRAVGPGLSQVPSHKRRLLDGAAAVRRGTL
jgi:hypothetical protein